MRDRYEIKEQFVEIARKMVRKAFRKRVVSKMSFSKEEMEEIKELDGFLRKVSGDNTDAMEKQLKNHKEYLCVVVKMKIKLKGGDMETYIHQYIKIEDFDYEKCEYYIAKAIHTIAKNKHAEIFFCVNGLRASYNERDICIPERKKKNVSYASSVFVDLDLPERYARMGNKELRESFESENPEFMYYLNPVMVRSGSGMHMYIPIETIDMRCEEKERQWRGVMGSLAFYLHKYGADIKCIDYVRILRPPHTLNRKEKYGEKGLEVSIMRDSEDRFLLSEVDEKLDYLIQGGDAQYFDKVLESMFFNSEYEDDEEQEDTMEGFIPLEFDDDIFVGEVKEYAPPRMFVVEAAKMGKKDNPKEALQKEGVEVLENPYLWREPKEEIQNSYQGISVDYDKLPDIFWQCKDLIFYLCNRRTSEGCRNLMLFFFAFNFYYFDGRRELDELVKMCQWINRTYFKPSLPKEEVDYVIGYCYKKFKENVRYKYIRNQTIQKYFPFTDEERQCTKGNYYPYGSKEYIEREKKVHAKEVLGAYYKKKRAKGEETNRDKIERTRLFIREHPKATYTQAKEVLGVSENFYYRQRKIIQKELGILKEKPDYESVFRNNPNITYEEFKKIFDVTDCTYYRKKKKYLSK